MARIDNAIRGVHITFISIRGEGLTGKKTYKRKIGVLLLLIY